MKVLRRLAAILLGSGLGLLVTKLLVDRERERRAPAPIRIPVRPVEPAEDAAGAEVPSSAPVEAERPETPPFKAAEPDDLTAIKGIGPKYARALNEIGITTFAQLAQEDPESLAAKLGVAESVIRRQDWIGQAARMSSPDR